MGSLLNMKEMTQESSFLNACFQFVPTSVVLLPPVEDQKGRRHKLADSSLISEAFTKVAACFVQISFRLHWLGPDSQPPT